VGLRAFFLDAGDILLYIVTVDMRMAAKKRPDAMRKETSMVFGGLFEEEGHPFTGRRLEKVKQFLETEGLSYDDSVEYTLLLTDEEGEIAACGSVAGNVLKCIAVSDDYQGEGLSATIVTGLSNYCMGKERSHLFLFTKPKNKQMFTDLGFDAILCTDTVLFMENTRGGIGAYAQGLNQSVKEARAAFEEAGGRKPVEGAIVANCNPFTLGHRYLIETALARCDLLHLFILSEDRSEFTAGERFAMVKAGIAGMERVFLHPTSDYLISSATFPTYFMKDKAKAADANCELDVRIFAECIAKPMGITKRFAGTEPTDEVTNAYNAKMKELLPGYGIEFVEIERKQAEGGQAAISAKRVRALLAEGKTEELKKLVPETTLEYLLARKQ